MTASLSVNYAGLPSSPWHERAKRLAPKGTGAVLAFELAGGIEAGKAFVNALKLHSHVANIGDVRSLVIHPASTTHAQLSPEEQLPTGVSPGLVRLAVGIEGIDDILADLELGFAAARKFSGDTAEPWRRYGTLRSSAMTISDVPTQTLPAEGEVGLVDIGPLTLENGAVIDDVSIAVQRWGELSPARDNVVVVLHALTGDSHITGPAGPGHPTPGWWDGVAGPGAPIDTDRWCAVATNVLGGCRGSTGPSSLRPRRKALGLKVSADTVRDQVEADIAALAALGITEVAAVVGGSMGGARALEWIVGHPDRVRAGLLLAVGARATADQIGTQTTQIAAIKADPNWQGGDYYETGRVTGRRAADRPPLRAPDLPRRDRAGQPVRQRRPGRRGSGDRRPLRGAELPGTPGRQAGGPLRRRQLRGPDRDAEQPRRRPRPRRGRRGAARVPGAGRGRWHHLRPALSVALAGGIGRAAAGLHRAACCRLHLRARRLPGGIRGRGRIDPEDNGIGRSERRVP